ncbi:MAG: hypothetical protein HYZ65_10465 [Burkholderiales bacterium]|nr:hypothetical protein [Burkholderiales bacterium]
MRAIHRTLVLLRAAGIALCLIANAASAQDAPPGRVGRLSYAQGSPDFLPAGSEQWLNLDFNRPLTAGDNVWVPRNGKAEIHIGALAVRLNEKSSLSFLNLSDDTVQLKLTQGTMALRVRDLPGKETVEVDTPNLAFSLQEPGEYRIDVNPDDSTTVTVRRGAGIVYGERDSVTLREAESATFSGTNLSHSAIARMPPYDDFDSWVNQRDRVEDGSRSAQYVSREIIGYQQLDDYGSWETNVEYGAVWFPRVTLVGWAPYRLGHWLWVAPWGWTWIDQAPWGFAPYHYGRWAYLGSRWAWVPGRHSHYERPVYAPALVAFVGGNGWSAGVQLQGRAAPGVAWFPLAPGEAYRPGYTSSSRYLERLNTGITVNNTTVINNTQNVYINQHVNNAVTMVPASVFTKGQAVAPVAASLNRQQLSNATIGTAAPAIAPAPASMLGLAKRVVAPVNAQVVQRPVVATLKPAEPPAAQPGLNERAAAKTGANRPEAGNAARLNPVIPALRAAPGYPQPGLPTGVIPRNPRVEPAEHGGALQPGRNAGTPAVNDGRVSNPAPAALPVAPQRQPERPRPDEEQGPGRHPRSTGALPGAAVPAAPESPRAPAVRLPDQAPAVGRPEARPEARPEIRPEARPEIRPEIRRESVPVPSPVPNPVPLQPRAVERPQPPDVNRNLPAREIVTPMPRPERAPNAEPRREASVSAPKSEKEKEHKEKPESHNPPGQAR